eukprot:439621_1
MAFLVSDVPETSISQRLSNVKGNFKQIKTELEVFDVELVSKSLNIAIDCSHPAYLQFPSINGKELIASYEYFRPSTSVTKSSYNNGLQFRLKYTTPIMTDIITQLYPDCKDKNFVYLSYNPSKHDASIFLENVQNEKENFIREMMNNIEKVIRLQDRIPEAKNEKEEEYVTEKDIPMPPLTNDENSDHPFGISPIVAFDYINWNSWKTEPDPLAY